MSIRFPHELAAAAEYAEGAVESAADARVAKDVRFADARVDLGLRGPAIDLAVGPGYIRPGAARKLIPGQTYH